MKIFVIIEERGSYSDYSMNLIKAFYDQKNAEKFLEEDKNFKNWIASKKENIQKLQDKYEDDCLEVNLNFPTWANFMKSKGKDGSYTGTIAELTEWNEITEPLHRARDAIYETHLKSIRDFWIGVAHEFPSKENWIAENYQHLNCWTDEQISFIELEIE